MLRKVERLVACTRHLDSFHRYLSAKVKSKPQIAFKESKRVHLFERKVFQNFLNSKQNADITALLDFPEKYFIKRMGRMPESFYIADKLAAYRIVEELKKNLPPNQLLMENSPGIGLLTKMLIDQTENNMFLFEGDKELVHSTADILDKHPHRKISLKHCDFTSLWEWSYLDKLDGGTRLDAIFEGVHRKKFDEKAVARLFACVGTEKFFVDLIRSVVFQNGFFLFGRIEMLLCVPPSVFFKIASSPAAGPFHYQPLSVLFQLFFEYELISKINRKLFLPWRTKPCKSSNRALYKIMMTDFEKMYLIRIVPRMNLFKFCLPENLPALWFFVRHHLGNNDTISNLEQWIPACGSKLKANRKTNMEPEILFPDSDMSGIPGFVAPSTTITANHFASDSSNHTEFRMLTPTQILTIFNQFVNLPEYHNCTFVDALEKELLKFNISPDAGAEEFALLEDVSDDDEEIKIIK